MKAVVIHEFGGVDKLRVEEVPEPQIGPGEALVRVRACGLNRADLRLRAGRHWAPIPLPHILGSEVAGEIAALGSPQAGLSVGQPVAICPWITCGRCEYCLAGEDNLCPQSDILGWMCDGGYAEFVRAPIANLFPLPPGLSYNATGAVTLATTTAWHMLVTRARVKPGEDVLVLAAGSGVGSAAIQIAKLCGARVIATASTAQKLRQAQELGADEVINYQEQDFLAEVRRLTNKRGVDIVVEHVGAETWEKSVASLARNGRLVICGGTTGLEVRVNLLPLFAKQLNLLGSVRGTRAEIQQVLKLTAEGKLKPVIHATYPLEGAAEAHRTLEERRQFGKLVLNP